MDCYLVEVDAVADGSALGYADVGGDDGRAAEPIGNQVAVEHASPAHYGQTGLLNEVWFVRRNLFHSTG